MPQHVTATFSAAVLCCRQRFARWTQRAWCNGRLVLWFGFGWCCLHGGVVCPWIDLFKPHSAPHRRCVRLGGVVSRWCPPVGTVTVAVGRRRLRCSCNVELAARPDKCRAGSMARSVWHNQWTAARAAAQQNTGTPTVMHRSPKPLQITCRNPHKSKPTGEKTTADPLAKSRSRHSQVNAAAAAATFAAAAVAAPPGSASAAACGA